MGIIASRSPALGKLLREAVQNQKTGPSDHRKIVIDFGGSVLYQAFKKLIDYCYLDDLCVLGQICDSTEMVETLKLANQYSLTQLVKAMESYFQEQMVALMESNSTCISINTPQQKMESSKPSEQTQGNGRGQLSRGAGAPQQTP